MTDIIPRADPETGVIAWNHTQRDLLRRMYASENVTVDEFNVFLEVSARAGLNPFNKQIYVISRGKGDNAKATIQVAIDGLRLIAQRSGEYDGSKVEWCGIDGIWTDVWVSEQPPVAAKAIVYRRGAKFEKVCMFREYVQTKPGWSDGLPRGSAPDIHTPTEMWLKMPANQIGKCAEAGALRMAFPAEMSGIFVDDEEAAMDRVAREEARRAERATPVSGPQRASQRQVAAPAQTAAKARTQPQRPQGPPPGENGEVPLEAEYTETGPMPWPAFWTVLSKGLKTLSKDGSNPNVAAIADALGIEGGLQALQGWYAENGESGKEAVALIVDQLEAAGFVKQ